MLDILIRVTDHRAESQWPRILRCGSAPFACWDRGFESRRRPWMSVSCECCVLLGRSLCGASVASAAGPFTTKKKATNNS
jgi:hypothetical protein